jgi:hypothetical protein
VSALDATNHVSRGGKMTSAKFWRALRYGLLGLAAIGFVLMFGFFTLQNWVTGLIPWELNRLAGIFLSSICAASSFPILWIALRREYAAVTGGGVNFAIMFAGFGALAFQAYFTAPRLPLLLFGLYCAAGFIASLGLIYLGLHQPFHDARPMPRLARISFVIFAGILTVTGLELVLKRPDVFPWQLTPQQSVLYGWIFLGAASYFYYGFFRPFWGHAEGQLLGFLAYDLILIVPFVALFFGNEPFLVPNLVFYIGALVYSGALAIWYLFVNRVTRISFTPSDARA